jgi:hypothetical protein
MQLVLLKPNLRKYLENGRSLKTFSGAAMWEGLKRWL